MHKFQKGFAPIQIILSILVGTVILGGIVGGVLYFIDKNSGPGFSANYDFKGKNQEITQLKEGRQLIGTTSFGSQKLTDFISSLSFTNAHNLVVSNDDVYLVFAANGDGRSGIYLKKSMNLGTNWQKEIKVSSAGGALFNPSLAISGNGSLYVVWQDMNGLVYYTNSNDSGSSWNAPITLYSASQKTGSLPDIASDGKYVYVAWMDANTDHTVLRASNDNGKNWGDEIYTSTCGKDAERPNLLIDNGGTLHQVWYDWCEGTRSVRTSGIYHATSHDHGATWQTVSKLVETATLAGHPYLIQDISGRLHLVYIKGSSSDVNSKGVPNVLHTYYRNSVDGVNWSEAVELDSDLSSAWAIHPQVAFSEKHGLMAVWGDQNTKSYYFRTSTDGGKTWSVKSTITTNENSYASAKIATDKNGDFHVIWEDDRSGKREIYYAKGDGSVDMFTVNVGSPGVATGGTSAASLFSLEGKSKPSQEKFSSINTANYTEKDPFVSEDGLRLYFFSNRGGDKLLSLYTASRSSITANWSAPQAVTFQDTAGNVINTSTSNKTGPYMTKIKGKDILFFSADGRIGSKQYGSYDLYAAEKISDTVFAEPKNLGAQINTADDELGGSVYFDSAKNKGIIFYAVGWKSNSAHNAAYSKYASYLGSKDENIWFNTFQISNGEYIFDAAKFFKYNKAGLIEDNPNLSADGKVLSYSAGTDPTQKNATAKYGDLEFYGDFDIFYTYLENNVWLTPRNLGGSSLNTVGHDANSNILLFNGQAYLFYTYAPTTPYQFDFREYFLGEYRAPSSSGDIFDNLPEMTEAEAAVGASGATSQPNGGQKPSDGQQKFQDQSKCGDGICGAVEKEKGVCPADCK